MLNFSPDQLYEVQRLHHQTLLAEAGLYRSRRTTQQSPQLVISGLRQLAFRWSQKYSDIFQKTRQVTGDAPIFGNVHHGSNTQIGGS
jgi:hypothetical protein